MELSMRNESPMKLVIRCLAERKDSQWQAVTLEFGLAAQGESLSDVKAKLEEQIDEYICDALLGEDRDHAYELLSRKAPMSAYLKFHVAGLLSRIKHDPRRAVFREPLPLVPKHCTA
jgi:hypothetical protein